MSEDNDHLGLIVSGLNEEIKNVDKNISSARNALFGFLGNIFSYKCKVSPAVQLHTWAIFVKPVLRSGLSALPIRPPVMKSLTAFHHKVLRAILKLSKHSPVVPLLESFQWRHLCTWMSCHYFGMHGVTLKLKLTKLSSIS